MSEDSTHPLGKIDDIAPADRAAALRSVWLPATVLLVVMSVLMVVVAVFTTLNAYLYCTGVGRGPAGGDLWMDRLTDGSLATIEGILALVCGTFILIGARKMKRLQSRGWAIAACILSLLPGLSPCCLIGLPIGVWGLMVINDPEVKGAFDARKS